MSKIIMNQQNKKFNFGRLLSFRKQSTSKIDVETNSEREMIKLSSENESFNSKDAPQPNEPNAELDPEVDEDISSYEDYVLEVVKEHNVAKLKKCFNKLREIIKQHLSETDECEETENEILMRFFNNLPQWKNPMYVAAECYNIDAVKLFLEHGADVDIRNDIGNTPLTMAAWGRKIPVKPADKAEFKFADETARLQDVQDCIEFNDYDLENEAMIECLISFNADPNAQDEGNQTSLHNAAFRGNVSGTRALLRCKDVIVDVPDNDRQTPLIIACNGGWTKLCELLIKAGALVSYKDKWNSTPLHYASKVGDCRIVEMLLQAVQNKDELDTLINHKNNDCHTALTLAIANDRENVVQILLQKGANVHVRYKNLSSTLHLASAVGNVKIMAMLLENGANVDWKDAEYDTSLHIACTAVAPDAVEYLLSKKADIEAKNKQRCTPFITSFQSAPSTDNLRIIQMLIDHGADTNASDKDSFTAVHFAAQINNVAALELLLSLDQCKQLVNRMNRTNNSPLHLAAICQNIEIFQCLMNHGAILDIKNDEEETPLHYAIYIGDIKLVQYMLEQDKTGNLMKETNRFTQTPLHLAAVCGHKEIVKMLLSYSKETLESKDGTYCTPLSLAAREGQKKTLEVLLDHGAKMNSDDSPCPPMHSACMQGHIEVVELLLSKGVQLDALSFKGDNCLEAAVDENKSDVAHLIIKHKKWKDVMKHSRTTPNFTRSTPLRELIIKMPDVAKIILDKCIIRETGEEDTDEKITYNYELIDDIYSNWSNDNKPVTTGTVQKKLTTEDKTTAFYNNGILRKEAKLYDSNLEAIKKNHPIMIMVSQDREELLSHELINSLIKHKWTSYVRYIYYSGLLLYIVFLAFLTDFAINSPPYYNHLAFFTLPKDFCHNKTITELYLNDIPYVESRFRFSQYMALILSVINILKELSQLYYRGKEYLGWQNIVEVFLYTTAIIFLIDWNSCSRFYGYRMPEQWLFGVAAALLAWVNLILMVRQFPSLGIYIVMFTDILRTFSKFFFVFFLLIVAFAAAFFLLFQNQAPFTSIARTIVKTLVMMVGGLDYQTMFFTESTDRDDIAYSPTASRTVFVVFTLTMTIVIKNLLVGLAVQDIKEVQNKAYLNRLAMKAELVMEIEYIAPEFIRRKFLISHKTVYPYRSQGLIQRWFHLIFPDKSDSTTIVDVSKESSEIKKPDGRKKVNASNVIEEICQLKQIIAEIKSQQERMTTALTAFAARYKVNVLADKPD